MALKSLLQSLSARPGDPDALHAVVAAGEALPAPTSGPGSPTPGLAELVDELTATRHQVRSAGALDAVDRLLELEARLEADDERRRSRQLDRARLLAYELLRQTAADALLEEVLRDAPKSPAAVELKRRFGAERKGWKATAKQLAAVSDPKLAAGEAATRLVDAALLHLRFAPESTRGDKLLAQALEKDPRSTAILEHRERRLLQQGKAGEAVALWEQQVALAPKKEQRASAHVRAARVLRYHVKRPERAAEHYKQAIAADGNDVATWVEYGDLLWHRLADTTQAEEIFQKLRRHDAAQPAALAFFREHYRRTNERAKWVTMLSQAHKAERVASRKVELAVELAEVTEAELGNAEKAIDAWRAVLRDAPGSEAAAAALVRLYTKTGRWNALLERLKETLEQLARRGAELPGGLAAERVQVQLQIAAVYRDRLGLDAMALGAYQQALALDPSCAEAFDALAGRYEQLGRWTDLAGLIDRRLAATQEPTSRSRLALRLAELFGERMGNATRASAVLEETLRLPLADDERAHIRGRLKELYQRRRSWKPLLDLLGEELDGLDPAARLPQLVAMAELATDRLADGRLGAELWTQVWRATEAAASGATPATSDRGLEERALRALLALYEREGKLGPLAEVLDRLCELTAAPGASALAAAPLLERRAAVYADLHGRNLATAAQSMAAYRRLLELVPDHAKARRALRDLLLTQGDLDAIEKLYTGTGSDEELVESLRAAAERATDPSIRKQLWRRLATLFETRLGQPDRAVSVYEKLHALEPGDVALLRKLAELYTKQQSWVRLLASQQELLAATQEPSERRALYREIMAVCERQVGAKGLAFDWCVRALAELPIDVGSLADDDPSRKHEQELLGELERLAAGAPVPSSGGTPVTGVGLSDRWEGWFDVVASRTSPLGDGALRQARVVALVTAALERSVPLGRARPWLEELLDKPVDADEVLRGQAVDALLQLLGSEQKWAELVARLELLVDSSEVAALPTRRLELLYQAASVVDERLTDRPRAIGLYRRALALEPASARASHALERLLTEEQRWDELVELWRTRLQLVADGEGTGRRVDGRSVDRGELLAKIGEVQEHRLGRVDEALASYREALREDPNDPVVVAALERLLKSPEIATRLSTPDFDGLVALLEPFYERMESWTKQAELLELARARHVGVEGRPVVAKLAALYGDRLDRPAEAYGCYAELFEAAPVDGGVRRRLLDAAKRSQRLDDVVHRFEGAAEVLRRGQGGDAVDGDGERVARELTFEAAQLLEGVLGRPVDAQERYRALVDADEAGGGEPSPLHRRAAEALARLLVRHGEAAALRSLFQRWAARPGSAALRRALWYRAALLCEEAPQDLPGAIHAYRQLLELGPGASERLDDDRGRNGGDDRDELDGEPAPSTYHTALTALERIYLAEGQLAELDGLLSEPRPGEADAERLERKTRRAELHAFSMHTPSSALDLLAEVVRQEPGHRGARRLYERLLSQPETREQVARILEPAYVAEEAWPKVVATLTVLLEHSPSAADDQELLAKIARIQEEQLGSRQAAFQTWIEALRRDALSQPVRQQVWRLGTLLDRWSELAAAWEEALGPLTAELSDEGRGRAARALGELATIYERLDDSASTSSRRAPEPRAVQTWRRVLELGGGLSLAPGTPGAEWTGRARQALQLHFQSTGQWKALVELLRSAAELTASLEERRALLHQVAAVQREAHSDDAASTLQELLHLAPDDEAALDGLEQICVERDDVAGLVELLYRRRELARDRGDRAAVRRHGQRIAELWSREVGDLDRAIDAYRELLDSYSGENSVDAEDAATHVSILETLARLYRTRQRWPELLETLHGLYRHSDPKRPRALIVALVMEIATVLDAKLSDPREAFDYYGEVLDLDPFHLGAREAVERMLDADELRLRATDLLSQLYRTQSDFGRLAALEQRAATAATETPERVARLLAAAELRERRLGDERGAYNIVKEAALLSTASPELGALLTRLEQLAGKVGTTDDFVTLLRQLTADVLDGELRMRLYLLIADHLASRPSTIGEASEYYQKVLEIAPGHPKALAALERDYESRAEWAPLLEIFLKRLDLLDGAGTAATSEERRVLLRRAARLCQDALGRPAEATSLLEQLVELAPDDPAGWDDLEAIYRRDGRFHDLASLLERRLVHVSTTWRASDIAQLRVKLGALYVDEVGEPDRALEPLCAVVESEPGNAVAVAALEKLQELGDPERRDRVLATLESVYSVRQDWKRLAALLERRVELATNEGAATVELHLQLARLYEEQLEDFVRAFDHVGAAFGQDPLGGNYEWLGRLANLLGAWQALADLLAAAAEQLWEPTASSHERSRWLLGELAELYEERLGNVQLALDTYRKLWLEEPNDEVAFARLDGCLTRARRFEERAQLYLDAQSSTPDLVRRRALLHEVARIRVESLGDIDGALEIWREIIDVTHAGDAELHDVAAEQAIERTLTSNRRWDELVEYLAAKITREASPVRRTALRLEEARIHEASRHDLGSAIDLYAAVLEDEPRHVVALEALERLILNPAVRLRVASTLEPIYRASEEWNKLIVVLDSQVELAEDVSRRIELLREVATLHEQKSGAVDLAFAAVARAWQEDPQEAHLFDELERLATHLTNWRAFVRVIELVAETIVDKEWLARVWVRAAQVYEQELGDRPRAVTAWLTVEPLAELVGASAQREALSALERLLGQGARHAELARVLERQAELSYDEPPLRAAALRGAALLYEESLDQPSRALEIWKELSTQDEGAGLEALDHLAGLYERAERWSELADTVARRIELAAVADPGNEAVADSGSEVSVWRLRWQLAELVDQKLTDPERAILAWQALVADGSAPVEERDRALVRLGQLYEPLARWRDAVEALEQRLALEMPDQSADLRRAREVDLHERAGRLLLDRLDETEGATAHYVAVLQAAPERPEAGLALERLSRGEGADPRAFDALRLAYTEAKRWDALVELLERQRAQELDPAKRRNWLTEIAAIHEHRRGQVATAYQAWAFALREEVADGELDLTQLREVERLAGAASLWRELVALYRELLDKSDRAEAIYRLATRLTAIYEELLGELGPAVEMCCKALEVEDGIEPDARVSPPLMDVLERLLERLERWVALVEVVQRRAERSADRDEQIRYRFRVGQLRLDKLGDGAGAVASWRDVLELDPGHREARSALEALLLEEPNTARVVAPKELAELRLEVLELLESLAERVGDFASWVQVQEWRLGLTDDLAARTPIFERMAERCERDAKDPVRALDALGRAFAEELSLPEPSSRLAHLVDQLERLAGEQGRWAELLARFEGALAADLGREIAMVLGLRAAKLALHRLRDQERSERHLRTVLAVEPESAEAWELMELVLRSMYDGATAAAAGGSAGAVAMARHAAARLEEALRARSRLVDETALRQGYLVEAAGLREQHMGDPRGALEVWREAVELDGEDRDAWDAIVRIEEQLGEHRALAQSLERLAELTPEPATQSALLKRLARLWVQPLGEIERAEQAFRDALALAPDDHELLEGLAQLYRQREDWPRLQEMLLVQLQWTEEVALRRRLLGEMARVADERLEDRASAITLWQQRRELAGDVPGEAVDEEAETALERLLAIDEQWEPLLDLLVAHAERCAASGKVELELSLLLQSAELAVSRLGDVARATELSSRAVERAPSDSRALAMVARLAEQAEDWQTCADTLERAIASAGPSQAVELRLRAARIYLEHLDQRALAYSHLEAAARAWSAPSVVTARSPGDDGASYDPVKEASLQATLQLERLAREAGDSSQLASWMERRVALLDDREARAALLLEAAKLVQHELASPERACALLEQAVALGAPGDVAVEPLAELTCSLGQFDRSEELVRLLVVRAQTARNIKWQARLRCQLGRIAKARGQLAEAMALFEEAHRLDSSSLVAQVSIASLAMELQDWDRARRTYRSLLLGTLDPSIGLTKADIYLALGRVHERLGESATARGMYQRGLELDSHHVGLRAALGS